MHAQHIIVPLSRGYMEYEQMVYDDGRPVLFIPSRYLRTVDYAASVVDACVDDLKEGKYLS